MTKRTPLLLLFLILIPMFAAVPRARADDPTKEPPAADRLVNLDTAGTAGRGNLDASLDLRFLSGSEDLTFGSLNVRYGLSSHLDAGVRAVTGMRRALSANNGSAIRYGGRDAEVYAKYGASFPRGTRVALLAGLSFPATPAQHNTIATLGAVAEFRVIDRVTAYLNPRAVLLDSNTIFGIGIGTSIRITNNVHVISDWTTIASGNNTLSLANAARSSADVWGVAVRLSANGPNSRVDFDLGYGNATGSTTGFSLTPGIGNSAGFYCALRARH